ncbi:MAG: DUF6273 domain-containing protein, partial [Eubacteriales bacterium]
MKRYAKRLLSFILALAMTATIIPSFALKSSAVSALTTGDIITYGSYPQTKVTDASLITALNACTLSADNTVTYSGTKYKRVYFTQYTPYYTTVTPDAANSYQDENGYYINTVYWFKYEPIQWRVLSNTNGELLVMAEKILDSKAYNQVQTNVTWETCSLRSWLNNDFYNSAFNSFERSRIKMSAVVNADNPQYGTEGGNNTSDKLILLSYADTINTAYGFSSSFSTYDTARQAQGTDFSKSNGLFVSREGLSLGNSHWWLRTPGVDSDYACGVYGYGIVDYYDYVNSTSIGIRPAFKISLTSDIFTSKAGSGCVIDYFKGFVYGI